jgi:hypothetical protein
MAIDKRNTEKSLFLHNACEKKWTFSANPFHNGKENNSK